MGEELVSTQGALENEVNKLYNHIAIIIRRRKEQAYAHANREVTLMYWEVGAHINATVLDGGRAAYGKKILSTLSLKLERDFGASFAEPNVYRMMRFAKVFADPEILSTLSTKLSWSHFCELMRIPSEEARLYYAADAAQRMLGVRELRRQISRKTYERREIANAQLSEQTAVPFNVFKDPYLLDTLGLRENYLEADLEQAILRELEAFILEFGHGFTFVARQKRMIMDDMDFTLDLLFYHRILRRFVAVELKLGHFKPAYKGQMEFYLKWLNRYERQPDENEPIGLILCPKASRSQIELMELDKAGIAVAEYWTVLPPKNELERKIHEIMAEAQERLERRKTLSAGDVQHKIDYYLEAKDDDDE